LHRGLNIIYIYNLIDTNINIIILKSQYQNIISVDQVRQLKNLLPVNYLAILRDRIEFETGHRYTRQYIYQVLHGRQTSRKDIFFQEFINLVEKKIREREVLTEKIETLTQKINQS